jgi:hypothetical protein
LAVIGRRRLPHGPGTAQAALLKPSRLILVARIDQHHSDHVTVVPDREPTCLLATSYLVMQRQRGSRRDLH